MHLLRFWKMDPSLAGVVKIWPVTVWQFKLNSSSVSLVIYRMARPELMKRYHLD